MIKDCNALLESISENLNLIDFIKPDYESINFENIENLSKEDAQELIKIKEAGTFSDAKYESRFSQKKYFKKFSDNIDKRLDEIRGRLVAELNNFVSHAIKEYKSELNNNVENKINELKEINEIKVENSEIMKYIEEIELFCSFLKGVQGDLMTIEKGIL